MITYYSPKEVPQNCLELLEYEYKQLGYPVEIAKEGVFCVLTEEEKLLACLSLNPSIPEDHGLFAVNLVETHKYQAVARIGTFASVDTLTRKQLRELWAGTEKQGRDTGYTFVIAIVTPQHARVWCALFGFKKLTRDSFYPRYNGMFSCIGREI